MKIRIYYSRKLNNSFNEERNLNKLVDIQRNYELVLEYESKNRDLNIIFLQMNAINIKKNQRSLSINDIIAIYEEQWHYFIVDFYGFTEITNNIKWYIFELMLFI